MQYRLWQVVTALIRRIPPRAGYAIAAAAGSAAFYCWPRGRRATIRNYQQVLSGAPPSDVRRMARRSLVNYCKYLTDFVRFPSVPAPVLIEQVLGSEQFEALDRALADGKGALIVCTHFGNWDLGAGATAARGYPLTVLAETFEDPRLDEMVVGARRRLGMEVIKIEKAGPSLVRALQRNGLLALLIDRPTPGDGVAVEFFGSTVEVPAGPARLALRTGAAVVPVAFARTAAGAPTVTTLADFLPAHTPTGDQAADVTAITQAIMAAHEGFIRRHPDQWYMFREMWPRPTAATR
ncbi:MAG: lysophospholipid acyltransferase family protein [Chloroflexi bacterium]|nr:lysophospholipid acyltransferase family protein [Chloroflexota bacterium]